MKLKKFNFKIVNSTCRIASSVVILEANESLGCWLMEAEQLVSLLPIQLHTVAQSLLAAVQHKTEIKRQGQIA